MKDKGTTKCIWCGNKVIFKYSELEDDFVETNDGYRKCRTTNCRKCHKKIIIT